MYYKLAILIVLALTGCNTASTPKDVAAEATATVETIALPEGVNIIEQHPLGYFIRVATAERATKDTIRALATQLSGKYDRVDLCTVAAHERGDEYASIIDGKLYDYTNDLISAID